MWLVGIVAGEGMSLTYACKESFEVRGCFEYDYVMYLYQRGQGRTLTMTGLHASMSRHCIRLGSLMGRIHRGASGCIILIFSFATHMA